MYYEVEYLHTAALHFESGCVFFNNQKIHHYCHFYIDLKIFFDETLKKFSYWNDRRLRSVFLCVFYSAIFKLRSTKFQTFAFNSKTVRPKSFINFDSSSKLISSMFKPKFEVISSMFKSRDFGFRTQKPPQKFSVKSCLIQKRLKYGKNIQMVICLKILFHRYQPSFSRNDFLSFFSS